MGEPLKPCAFCGSNNILPLLITEPRGDVRICIQCAECSAQGPVYVDRDPMIALPKAHEYWNIRK